VLIQGIALISNSKTNDLTEIILNIIKERKPRSVKQLTTMLGETLKCSESETLKLVLKLQDQGLISLEDQGLASRSDLPFAMGKVSWYLLTIMLSAITATLVFMVPENSYPWIYFRNTFGLIFVLFLPGYAFTKALFPAYLPGQISSNALERIVRLALSIGLSIALVSIVGLLLYYSPWSLSLPAIVISLFVFVVIFATVGFVRSTSNNENVV
jgi:uncharacterized membrane protein